MASKAEQRKEETARAGKNNPGRRPKDGDPAKGTSDTETAVEERKSCLLEEYKTLREHMDTYVGRVEHLLREKQFLEWEAQQNQEESDLYLSYIAKHNQRNQGLIITLGEQNQADHSQVAVQREELISEYVEKQEEVSSTLRNVEEKFCLLSREVEDLQPFKDLSVEQARRIKELEKELLATRTQHVNEMHQVKSRFLQAKADCELESQQKIQDLTRRAEAAATQALIQYIQQVKAENWHLRRELLGLIQYSKVLKETKAELLEQQEQLLREHQLTQAMARRRRRVHQHQAHSAMGRACSSHGPVRGVH
ncbi:CC166 protein, partial [Aegotheles bennettii]|nr:CC166 protein [Aegotheles bennettii]